MRSRVLEMFGDKRNVDPFRLSIVGFSKIEEAIKDGLAEAFGGEVPPGLRQINFRATVALMEALELAPPGVFGDALGRLKRLRDEFAHGKRTELSPSDGRELYAAACQIAPGLGSSVPALKTEDQAEIHLMNLLLFVEVGLEASFEEARERRRDQQEAMAEWWRRRQRPPLTLQQITELIESEAEELSDDGE